MLPSDPTGCNTLRARNARLDENSKVIGFVLRTGSSRHAREKASWQPWLHRANFVCD